MSKHIFISYKREEASIAWKLVDDLRSYKLNIWIDHEDILVGNIWQQLIENALQPSVCAAFIALISPQYVISEWCLSELRRAKRLNIPILPILIEDITDSQVPIAIEGKQFFDLKNWRDESIYPIQVSKFVKNLHLTGAIDTSVIELTPDQRVSITHSRDLPSIQSDRQQNLTWIHDSNFYVNDIRVVHPALATRQLLHNLWLQSGSKLTSFQEMETAFSELGFLLIDQELETLSIDDAIKYISKELILNEARFAKIINFIDGRMSFYHPIFLEYFAAVKVAEKGFENFVVPLDIQKSARVKNKWDQVVITVSGLINNQESMVAALAEIDIYLAAACIGCGVSASERLRLEIYRDVFNRRGEWIRCNAIKILRHLRDPLTIPFLVKALADEGREIRPGGDYVYIEAKHSLALFGEIVINDLVEALKNPKAIIRGGAAEVLGNIGNPKAVPALNKLLDDIGSYGFGIPWYVCNTAAASLKKIGSQDAVLAFKRWQNDILNALGHDHADEKPNTNPFWFLQTLWDEDAVEGLIQLLYSNNSIDKQNIIDALQQIGTSSALLAVATWKQG